MHPLKIQLTANRFRFVHGVCVAFLLALCSISPALSEEPNAPPRFADLRFKLEDLGVLPEPALFISGASDDFKRFVGFGGGFGVGHAVLWNRTDRKNALVDLGTLGGEETNAEAVNNKGIVVGNSLTKSGVRHAFVWRDSKMTDLTPLGGESWAVSVNERGDIAGIAQTDGPLYHPVVWRNGVLFRLDDPNDIGFLEWTRRVGMAIRIYEDGTISGIRPRNGNGFVACTWDNTNKRTDATDFPSDAGHEIFVNRIGEAASAFGYDSSFGLKVYSERWSMGRSYRMEDALRIRGVNASNFFLASGYRKNEASCFLFNGRERIVLNDFLPPDWTFYGGGIFAINSKNEAVGYAIKKNDPNGRHLIVLHPQK